jgi:class 3 adenylate cyclase
MTVGACSSLPTLSGLSVRIALHAGPVFEVVDPITRRLNVYGAHVNRTARMEPVTVPGSVYVSEQFVGMLAAERIESGIPGNTAFAWDYVGQLSLAKNFGVQRVYQLRRVGS